MLWDVTPAGPGRFRGTGAEGSNGRLFGGQVASQALAAALADGRVASSLQVRFVREGRGGSPIDYVVAPVGDSHRLVTATQGDRVILTLAMALGNPGVLPPGSSASPAPSLAASSAASPAAWVPSAEDADAAAWLGKLVSWVPFDIRFAGRPAVVAGRRGERAGAQSMWLRTRAPLAAVTHDHQCALTYISDLLLVSTALSLHGLAHGPAIRSASLDHAIWFHAPLRADAWFRYDQEATTTGGGRGMLEGRLSDPDGQVVATVRQEAMIRSVTR